MSQPTPDILTQLADSPARSAPQGAPLVFPPETILPAQYFDRSVAELDPWRKLMLAILEDALECAMNQGISNRIRNRRREAHLWIFTRGLKVTVSFEMVCEALNLEPDYVRGGLTAWLRLARVGKAPRPTNYRQNRRTLDIISANGRHYAGAQFNGSQERRERNLNRGFADSPAPHARAPRSASRRSA